jgi:hypothetical protein
VKTRVVAVFLLCFGAISGVALASSPKAGELYTSEFLTVTVAKPATTAKVFIECLSSKLDGQWMGTVTLKHGSFKFDKKTTIKELPSGTKTGVVDVTGTFKNGGFACATTSYRTKAGAGGSGG